MQVTKTTKTTTIHSHHPNPNSLWCAICLDLPEVLLTKLFLSVPSFSSVFSIANLFQFTWQRLKPRQQSWFHGFLPDYLFQTLKAKAYHSQKTQTTFPNWSSQYKFLVWNIKRPNLTITPYWKPWHSFWYIVMIDSRHFIYWHLTLRSWIFHL